MKLKTLSSAILLTSLPVTGAFAAAMDRSGQSMSAFLQPGNYFEAGLSILDPGGVSKSMLKKSRLNFDKIEKCK